MTTEYEEDKAIIELSDPEITINTTKTITEKTIPEITTNNENNEKINSNNLKPIYCVYGDTTEPSDSYDPFLNDESHLPLAESQSSFSEIKDLLKDTPPLDKNTKSLYEHFTDKLHLFDKENKEENTKTTDSTSLNQSLTDSYNSDSDTDSTSTVISPTSTRSSTSGTDLQAGCASREASYSVITDSERSKNELSKLQIKVESQDQCNQFSPNTANELENQIKINQHNIENLNGNIRDPETRSHVLEN